MHSLSGFRGSCARAMSIPPHIHNSRYWLLSQILFSRHHHVKQYLPCLFAKSSSELASRSKSLSAWQLKYSSGMALSSISTFTCNESKQHVTVELLPCHAQTSTMPVQVNHAALHQSGTASPIKAI